MLDSKDYRVVETIDDKKLTIVFYKHKDIQSIKEKSNCDCGEYQVHYTALVRQEVYNDYEINLVFPLVFFNYPQKVTSVTIDFDRKDIVEKVSKLTPLSIALKDKLIAIFENNSTIFKDCKSINYRLTHFNNIHRHP